MFRFVLFLTLMLASAPALAQVEPTNVPTPTDAEIERDWGVFAKLAGNDYFNTGSIHSYRWEDYGRTLIVNNYVTNSFADRGFHIFRDRYSVDQGSGTLTHEDDRECSQKRFRTQDLSAMPQCPFRKGIVRFASLNKTSVTFDVDTISITYELRSDGRVINIWNGVPINEFIPLDEATIADTDFKAALTSEGLKFKGGLGRVETPELASTRTPTLPQLDIMQATGARIALVIGNSAYTGSMAALDNPVNDARLIGETLRKLGFEVVVLTDASQRDMKISIRDLGERMAKAGSEATGLFFYAGHGVQAKGTNFLIPVQAQIDSEADLDIEAVSANAVLRQMEDSYVSTNIIILDACRNMPLKRKTRGGARGLARMNAPNGSFIAYSTSPGNVAADGGGRHSPYAEALAEQMLVPDRPIEVTFRNVRRQVVQMTDGDQTPWDASSLLDTFSFAR